ncbi:hypothetical protein GCM10007352_14610 [Mucilaginibacter phyllosphaerae]|nr:hypothetical protein GCM10007352_14610 [Mucilaginibacter phyllosphaerae]
MPHLFITPKNYVVTYTKQAPKINGHINDPVWQQAAWTDKFIDIEGDLKPAPNLNTQMKMLWGDSCLFIAVKMEEPHLWANLTRHDAVIFNDNDFEIFIDPDGDGRDYFEIEVNQLNKIFDLFMPKPYRDRGDALISWDTPGMQSAVQLQGTLNNPADKDTGWTVEFKIPFSSVKMGFAAGAPKEGDLWRVNFSRVEWDTAIKNGKYVKLKDAAGKKLPERNWVWSAPGIINMHAPERWGYLQFTKSTTADKATFTMPYADLQKQYLWLVYYKQREYRATHQAYANNLPDLGIDAANYTINSKENTLTVEGTKNQFIATITDGGGKTWSVDNSGALR